MENHYKTFVQFPRKEDDKVMQIDNKIKSLMPPFIHLLFINELSCFKYIRKEENID